jgi:hypothetical protein
MITSMDDQRDYQRVTPAHCGHIAMYYAYRWYFQRSIGNKVLWVGYAQWAAGTIEAHNNLYDPRQIVTEIWFGMWCAFYADTEERGEYGYGATEREAVTDLVANY